MKRKSIFLTILAVFFASVSWGQQPNWPTSYGDVSSDAVGSDTIYFCASADSLYPIELGYDIAKKQFHPSYGDWSLYTTTSADVTAVDYVFGAAKNEGAGNAYKTVGSGIGGYVFQYKSENGICGLNKGQIFLVYAFILPDLTGPYQPKQPVQLCVSTAPGTTVDVKFNDYFEEVLKVYEDAGFDVSWKDGGEFQVSLDTPDLFTFSDTLIIGSKKGYTCGAKGEFKLEVQVKDAIEFNHIALYICAEDTVGKAAASPNHYFKRADLALNGSGYSNSYNPAYVIDGTAWSTKATKFGTLPYRAYKYEYITPCGSGEVYDTIYLLNDALGDKWGVIDTVSYCRTPGNKSIYSFYDLVDVAKLPLDESNSHWYDRGLKGAGFVPADGYGTTDGLPSLWQDQWLRIDSMNASILYYYLWQVDPGADIFSCLVNANGEGDSGYLAVIIQDKLVAQDYTAQLCGNSYSTLSYAFDVSKYTGIDKSIVWYSDAARTESVTTDGVWTIPTDASSKVKKNTYKLYYTLASTCASGKGVFYIKVGDAVKVSGSKEVLYCLKRLPSQINLNDVLNVAVGSLQWSATTSTDGFSADGIVNVTEYINKNGLNSVDLVYEVSSGGDCGVNSGTKVTIKFVTDIL